MKKLFFLSVSVVVLTSITVRAYADTRVMQRIVSCSAGNFTGSAKVDITLVDWVAKQAKVTGYKITKINNQQGGNRANLHLLAEKGAYMGFPAGFGNLVGVGAYSNDNLRQDGAWHSPTSEVKVSSSGLLRNMTVKFIFDKDGADPSCQAAFR